MLNFKNIELTDKEWVSELLSYSDFRSCEYSFGNNYIWKSVYNIQIARYKDFYLIKSDGGFFFPAGRGDLSEAITKIKEYCDENEMEFKFITMNKSSKEWLETNFSTAFEFGTNRDMYDYIYTVQSLATLSGKKLHSKRNHINRFRENNWSYEEITDRNIDECMEMSLQWCIDNNCSENSELKKESCAVNCGLKNFHELGFKGGVLRVDGKIKAFTFGEKLNSDTFVVHVEKALTDVQGAYAAINLEFVNHECMEYMYVNREEDLGQENLRKAKLSYKPVFLEEKYYAVWR